MSVEWRPERENFTSTEGARRGTGSSGSPAHLMLRYPTIPHALAAVGRAHGGTGITLLGARGRRPDEHMTYGELHQRANRAAARMSALGVGPGERVLLVLPTSFDFVVAFFAAQLLGAVPVPAYPPLGLHLEAGVHRLNRIARNSSCVLAIAPREILPLLADIALRAPDLRRVVPPEELILPGDARGPVSPPPQARAFIQYTSGSTGHPKGVVLTHHNVVSNVHAIGLGLEVEASDTVVSWCPLYHDMGLVGALLFSIYWGLPFVLMAPSAFLQRPERWLRAIHEHRGTLSPAPNFGYSLAVQRVSEKRRLGLDLSCWRAALNGAETVNLDTVEAFVGAYAPHGFRPEAMLPVYGLAEATVAVAFPTLNRGVRHEDVHRHALVVSGRAEPPGDSASVSLVSVGRALPGHRLTVVDREGRPLPERAIGEVIAAGPSIMEGYLEDQAASDRVLRAEWLWTGDLGYISDGELYISGRLKDVVSRHGRKYPAEDLETAAERVDGVRSGRSVALGIYDQELARDRVVMVCETRLTETEERRALVERIKEMVQRHAGVPVDEVVLVGPGTIPRTSSGKRQRSLCRERYLENRLEPSRPTELPRDLLKLRAGAGFLLMRVRNLFRRRPGRGTSHR